MKDATIAAIAGVGEVGSIEGDTQEAVFPIKAAIQEPDRFVGSDFGGEGGVVAFAHRVREFPCCSKAFVDTMFEAENEFMAEVVEVHGLG